MTGRCPRCGHEADAKDELLRALIAERFAPNRTWCRPLDNSDPATARRRRRLLEELDEYGQQRRKGA